MPTYHTVQQGECLTSIAKQYGFMDYRQIYDNPQNTDFRKSRPNPNIVYPGDKLYIPARETKMEDGSSGECHTFLSKQQRANLRLCIKSEAGQPCSSARYSLMCGAETFSGSTGGDGVIHHQVAAEVKEAILDVWIDHGLQRKTPQRWMLKIGSLDPVEKPRGIQARLNNLFYECGEVDGIVGPKTRAAIRRFQEDHGLEVDGIAGPKTQAELKGVHGC